MRKIALVLALATVVAAGMAVDPYHSAQQKIAQIDSEKLKAGTRLIFTSRELEACAEHEAPPTAIRNPANWSCRTRHRKGGSRS